MHKGSVLPARKRGLMIALQISSLKHFMNQLLAGDAFDAFLLEEATVSTANTYTIDGHINRDFFPPDEQNEEQLPYAFQPWSEIKGLCFNLIKGKHTPIFFKFVLHLKPEKAAALLTQQNSTVKPDNVKALVLNIRYDGTKAILTTGTAYHTFLMNKDADFIWDKALCKHLTNKEIAFEEL